MSWSNVLRAASSKAKFGAAEKHRPLVASLRFCIRGPDGFRGLINIARRPGHQRLRKFRRIRPIS